MFVVNRLLNNTHNLTFVPTYRNLARVPAAGRNWEGSGGDPYLSGEASYETVIGMQSAGVQAWYVALLS